MELIFAKIRNCSKLPLAFLNMCSNPITFIQALAKILNELLYTLNCHLIVPKHCHKSKWSKPSTTGIKNTTLVTFWKHKLKNAYCHLIQGEGGRPAIIGNKWPRRLWLFTFSLGAWELMAANQHQDPLSPNCPQLYLPWFEVVRSKGPVQKEVARH